jgi:predicted DNA binding protein
MREAKVAVYHQGCWGSSTTEKFPDVNVKLFGPVNLLNHGRNSASYRAVWEITAPQDSAIDEYVNRMKRLRSTREIEVLHRGRRRALMLLSWKGANTAYEKVLEAGCVYGQENPSVLNGYEIHTVLSPDVKALNHLLGELGEIGEVKILRIGEHREDAPGRLTERQKQALQTALFYDYYSWPRRVTLEELARTANLSRVSFQEHLRKAEAKLFPKLIRDTIN